MDIHAIGQKAVLHDCIRSRLADEVVFQAIFSFSYKV